MKRRSFAVSCFASLMMVILLAACGTQPKGVLSQKKMQKVMSDMLLAEAAINRDGETFYSDSLKSMLYQSVFDKHHVTKAEYDSSIVWYGKNLDVYLKIYDRVVADYDKKEEEIQPLTTAEEEKERLNRDRPASVDTVDIWKLNPGVTFDNRCIANSVVFNYGPADKIMDSGTFLFKMETFGTKRGSEITVQLCVQQRDTLCSLNKTIKADGPMVIRMQAQPTKGKVTHVYGYILFNKQPAGSFKTVIHHIQLISIRRPGH